MISIQCEIMGAVCYVEMNARTLADDSLAFLMARSSQSAAILKG